MTDKSTVDNRLRSIFDGYLSLQNESYEFISRTIAMHNWLREAYRIFQENPQFGPEKLIDAWDPVFGQVYQHLFAALLRPYRAVMFPFGELLGKQPRQMRPKSLLETNWSLFEIVTEAQTRFLKGFSTAVQNYGEDVSNFLSAKGELALDDVLKVSPLNLAKQLVDEETKAYFEMAERFFGLMGESQFLFPKSAILHLQKLFDAYPKIYSLSQRYEEMVRQTWQSALERFAAEIAKEREQVEFKSFFNTFINVLAREYDQLLRSPEFEEVQSSFLKLTSESAMSLRKAIEDRMAMFPYLPFVTVSEMEELEESVHTYKKKLNGLERKLAELEERLSTPQRAGAPSL